MKVIPKTKQTKKRATEIVEESDDTHCSNCNQLYNSKDDWIQCDLCDRWYDRICQDIDETTFQQLGDEDWYCKQCCQ